MNLTFSCHYAAYFFYLYIDCSLPCYDPLHMTLYLLSICTKRLWAYYLGFCLHFSTSIFLSRCCVMWHPFTPSHHDSNPCTFCFYFFRFNYYERVLYIWYCVAISHSNGLLLGLLTMTQFSCAHTLICLRLLIGFWFNCFFIPYPHSKKCNPHSYDM